MRVVACEEEGAAERAEAAVLGVRLFVVADCFDDLEEGEGGGRIWVRHFYFGLKKRCENIIVSPAR